MQPRRDIESTSHTRHDIPSRVRPLVCRGSCPRSRLSAPALQQKGATEHAHIPHGLPPAPAVPGPPVSTCLLPPGTSSFMGALGSGGSSLLASPLLRNKRAVAAACVLRGSPTSALRAGQCSAVLPAEDPCSWRRCRGRASREEAGPGCLAAAGRLRQRPGGGLGRNARSAPPAAQAGSTLNVGLTDVPSDSRIARHCLARAHVIVCINLD